MEGDSIWGSKDCQVPEYFNFADVLDEWAQKEENDQRESNTPALWWVDGEELDVKWNFQDLASNSKRAVNVLCTTANIKPGDRVMILVHRIPEYWLIQLACIRIALVPVPANIGPPELHRRISACKPACFVAGGGVIENDLLDVIDKFSSSIQNNVKCRLMVNRMKETNRGRGTTAKQVKEAQLTVRLLEPDHLEESFSNQSKRKLRTIDWAGWLSFEELFRQSSNEHQSFKSLSSTPITIVFTSGTTGNSKMVESTQGSWGFPQHADMEKPGIGLIPSDLCWFHSSTGWAVLLSSALSSWSAGAGFFAHYKDVEAREALEILQTFPITSVFFLPRIYISASKEDLKSLHLPKLSSCMTGSELMNKDVILKWKEETGIDLREVYGQTEVGVICCSPRNGENRIGSVGSACPGVDVVVIDDNNQDLCPGKIGRIVVRVKPYRPVGLFSRYVDDDEKTAARFSGDFYITGDLGCKDEDGYFWILGRTDDIIFVNGVNINPYIVEECLTSHQAVLECAVVSSPDPLGQTSVKAFVMLSSDFKNKKQDEMIKELQDYVAKKTGAWMSPRKIEFVDAFPTTLTGKVNRTHLKREEWNQFNG